MARRSKAEAEQTRAAILDAAEKQFFDKGVSCTTLSHIASAAGVTRGAIYWHFANKTDLFNAMLERIHLPFRQMLSELQQANEQSTLTQIKEVMSKAMLLVEQDPQYHRVLTIVFHRCEYIEELNPVVVQQDALNQDVLATLTTAFARAAANGELNETVSARDAALALNAMVGGILSQYLQHPGLITLSEHLDALLNTLFVGLAKQ